MGTAKSQILVTGGSGFIGKPLCEALHQQGYGMTSIVRQAHDVTYKHIVIPHINRDTDWAEHLKPIGVVIHTAGCAHVLKSPSQAQHDAYMETNYHATLTLARDASKAGVKTFIHLSTIKVYGENPPLPLTETTPKHPEGIYAQSKALAEDALRELDTDMRIIILQLPLVIGPNPKGNLPLLIRAITRGIPLPFGSMHHTRHMLSLQSLIDICRLLIKKDTLENNTFLLANDPATSTKALTKMMAHALEKKACLVPVPLWFLKIIACMCGNQRSLNSLSQPLHIDTSHVKETLGWTPSTSLEHAINEMVNSPRPLGGEG